MQTRHQALESEVLGMLQTFDVRLLSAIARGEVDASRLARRELSDRGLNGTGKWVGFDEARHQAERICGPVDAGALL